MGVALWLTCALAVFAIARIIPAGKPTNYLNELAIAIIAALAFGAAATALDFGGWRDTDWRAVVFVLLGCAAATGAQRALHLARN
jgi:hypothetical protein